LWRALARPGDLRDVAVTIDKRIPVEAGLGGGSADAAAPLLGLARVWGAAVGREDLQRVAAAAGADVPFFLSGGTALGLGRGDEIYRLEDFPPHWVVVTSPPFAVATSEAYNWYDSDRADRSGFESMAEPSAWPMRSLRPVNDLESPVGRRHPEIVAIKAACSPGARRRSPRCRGCRKSDGTPS
jgi:4-diphosphocytidyl-2-C-methyl-D-erythritol kinase